MTSTATPPNPTRLTALDVFRGITLAGMILVNNPGTWAHIYAPLEHAKWNGWTPTDLVFPSFLFIVGTAIPLAFHQRRMHGQSRGLLLLHAGRRSILLFVLGLLLAGVKVGYINGRSADEISHWVVIVPYVLTLVALGILWPSEGRIARDGWQQHRRPALLSGGLLVATLLITWSSWDGFQESALRVPGVLQRIALCYFIASAIVLYAGIGGRVVCLIACLVGYWAIVHYVSPPAGYLPLLEGPGARLHDWIDVRLLGNHLYSHRPDPEGLLSTLPAVGTTLLGVLAGDWLRSARSPGKKSVGLLLAGIVGLGLGLVLDRWDPINKKIWTDAYVLFAGGFSLCMLALCYLVLDVAGWRRWAAPFLVLGTNTIAIYVLSGLVGWLLALDWQLADGVLNVKRQLQLWLLEHFAILSPEAASLVFALGFVLAWILLFAPLYRARVFIRI